MTSSIVRGGVGAGAYSRCSIHRATDISAGPSNLPCLVYNPSRNAKCCFRELVRLRKCISRGHLFVCGNAAAEATGSGLHGAADRRSLNPGGRAKGLSPDEQRKDGDQSESDESEPWLGAVIFKRSSVRTHYEFETSLERLGMGFLSSEASRTLANSMGLASSRSEPLAEGTPVIVSIDVAREGERKDLRLEGIVRTTMSLRCSRCLAPVAERIFADFSLLLTEEPVNEPSQQRIGVVIGSNGPVNDEPELDIDLDDKLHFPKEEKLMDLSKYLRDTVHLEIPAKSLCAIRCLGLCISCGVNLNKGKCSCSGVEVKESWGPLEQLKTQLEEDGDENGFL